MHYLPIRYVVTPNLARLSASLDRSQHSQCSRAPLMSTFEQVCSRSERVKVVRHDLSLHVFPKVLRQPMAKHVHDVGRQLAPIRFLELERLLFRFAHIIVGEIRRFIVFRIFRLGLTILGQGVVAVVRARPACTPRRRHGLVGEEIEQRLVSISREPVERLLDERRLEAAHFNQLRHGPARDGHL